MARLHWRRARRAGPGVIALTATMAASGVAADDAHEIDPQAAKALYEARTAPGADDGPLDVLVVTAQKRAQPTLDVPIALTVADAATLRRAAVDTIYELAALTPGLGGVNPSNELTQVSIRGVSTNDFGIGSDPAIGVFVDDVYLGRAENTVTTFVDLERAEIARGPQGALFGRATPGGAIALVTKKPHAGYEASLTAAAGEDARRELIGVVNAPVSDGLWARAVGYYDHQNGYVRNRVDGRDLLGEETVNLRVTLHAPQFGAGETTLTVWGERFRGDAYVYDNLDLADFPRGAPLEAVEADADPKETRDIAGGILRYDRDAGWARLSSISSALWSDTTYIEDFDGSALGLFDFSAFPEGTLVTQEVRAVSQDGGRLTWFAGVLGYAENVSSTILQSYDDGDLCAFFALADTATCAGFEGERTDTVIMADADNRGAAAYGEIGLRATGRLTVTAGARATYDDREFTVNSPTPGGNLDPEDVGYITPTDGEDSVREAQFTSVQGRVALTAALTDGLSVYAAASNGEKPGGFSTFQPFSDAFEAESVVSGEIGAKGAAGDGTLSWALAAYRYDYRDLQVGVLEGPRLEIRNAGEARGYGLEGEVAATPSDRLTLRLTGAWTDARYERFEEDGEDFAGNRLVYTPEFTASAFTKAAAPLRVGLDAFAQALVDFRSRQFFSPANTQFASQPAFVLVDVAAGVERRDGRWRLEAFIENAFNERFIGLAEEASAANFGAFIAQPGRPRIAGVRVSAVLR